jgi:anti-anti-sigma regulatory factor
MSNSMTVVRRRMTDRFSAYLDSNGWCVLVGELDGGELGILRAVLDQAMLEPSDLVVLDASQLVFIDSRAVGEILRYALAAAVARRHLCIVGARPCVITLLERFELGHILLLEPCWDAG